uniref:Brix domain-containing protein n=1 Tax=Spongospora subterranea TaxID=70186 RepID=A0A0H5RMK3_9EUKA|eukprot:CRZ09949.1 hypothetical protein [Spongospora subterranea]
MYKRKRTMDAEQCLYPEEVADAKTQSQAPATAAEQLAAGRLTQSKYVNKQRTLVFSTQGIRYCDRHLMSDLRDLLPHSKKESKFDNKGRLFGVNDACDMKNCNSCLFFEARRSTDLYLWMAKTPHGPSAKFLVQNLHTMDELKLTGNCLKGSRPVLSFDAAFDRQPHLTLLKQMFIQIFGSPRGHPKTKPFVDHVLSFFYLDGRIWFRNYQIVYGSADPTLVEIGPRFCLMPIKVFAGSFEGETLYANPDYVTPTKWRMVAKRKNEKKDRYVNRVQNTHELEKKRATFADMTDELDTVFD